MPDKDHTHRATCLHCFEEFAVIDWRVHIMGCQMYGAPFLSIPSAATKVLDDWLIAQAQDIVNLASIEQP